MASGWAYAIAPAVESGAPVVAIEGDSAFGFSGMDVGDHLPLTGCQIVVIILNTAALKPTALTPVQPTRHRDPDVGRPATIG